ncbi:MAG TPA: tetratricopeptide repeat protein, partial [Urbifossiella sp.]|nr:tetratricopeptide repeat protein [Urbifossiella sp.]
GTPRFLELLRKTLQTCDGGKLWKELKAGAGLVEEARDRYIEGIFGDKLFASLTDDGRLAATRVAVALLPVPLDGVAMATGLPEPRAKAAVSNALAYGLLQEIGGTTLRYQAPGLLAGWLAAPARLLPADATAAHLALAGFWRGVVEGDREGDIGVHFMEGLDGCRRHAATGGDPALALWSASRMASALTRFAQWGRSCELLTDALKGLGDTPPPEVDEERAIALHELGTAVMRQGKFEIARGHFREALDLNRRAGIVAGEVASRSQLAYIEQATGNMAAARAEYKAVADAHRWAKNELGEANARHNLASLDLAQGDFPAARAELTEVLAIRQRLQDHRGEADTLHQLAAVDMLQGDYPAARDTTHRALEIQRREGDVAGQADSHYQLGCVALHQGRHEAGVRLIAACVLIEQQIGYKDAPKDLDGLLVLCQRLGYDEAQIRDMFADVAKSYAHDRGDALLREAFPDADWWKSPTDPPTPSSS